MGRVIGDEIRRTPSGGLPRRLGVPGAAPDLATATSGTAPCPMWASAPPRPGIDVLVIEDNAHYAEALRNNLEIAGFVVHVMHDGVLGAAYARERSPQLILLDIALPGHDGHDVLRSIRDEGLWMPILLLSSRTQEADKIRAFNLGADDYVTKPVSILELVARIRAVLRRTYPQRAEGSASICFGDIEVHTPTRSVRLAGQLVELRPKEYDLLLALLRQRGRIVSRAELLREVWGYEAGTVSRTVDTHIATLRQKIEMDPLNPRYVITVRTAGYLLGR
jgi:DNA-binding response OmpR family regulator